MAIVSPTGDGVSGVTPDVLHKHIIVRAEIGKPPVGKAETVTVEDWMRDLITGIDMKIMFGPRAMYCEVVGNKGMTGFAIIETSHVALHVWDECVPAVAQLDVYTCSDLTVEQVVPMLDVFEPSKVEYKLLDRQTGLVLLSEKLA
jgi:S-adenosylmethionine/arginine decarboxylase-like enzyme